MLPRKEVSAENRRVKEKAVKKKESDSVREVQEEADGL